MTTTKTSSSLPLQPTLNMGIVGHVDHGKTTLTKLLSGRWTDTHSEEKKRGITIKLGYTNFKIFHDKGSDEFMVKKKGSAEPLRHISIVDAPGHESFMATMISGAAVMDCALVLVAANEKCPQPQTIEHIRTLEIAGIDKVIIVQNKIDLVSREEALANFDEISAFLKTTRFADAPIIPISAQHSSTISELLRFISEKFEDPVRDMKSQPLLNVVRSFDINKPGQDYSALKGGIIGGSIIKGELKVGDEIEIKPGLLKTREGKKFYVPIEAKVEGLMSDKDKLDSAIPGGSVAVMTKLDPTLTGGDALVGQMAGLKGETPDPLDELSLETHLFEKVVTAKGDLEVKALIRGEPLMLIVNSLATVGVVSSAKPGTCSLALKRPVMGMSGDRAVLFRRFEGNKWRIMGYGILK